MRPVRSATLRGRIQLHCPSVTYRDEREALATQNEQLRRDLERMAAENAAMREALEHPNAVANVGGAYARPVEALSEGQRVVYGRHALKRSPVALWMVLHVLTFGVSSIVHFGRMHGRLPRIENDDPSSAHGIWLFLVPYYNLYWLFFSPARLVDRINFQQRLRGAPEKQVPSWPVTLASVLSLFFYTVPIVWLLAVWKTQRAVNDLADQGDYVPAVQRRGEGTVRVAMEETSPRDEREESEPGAGVSAGKQREG
jgi:hypothetical protein